MSFPLHFKVSNIGIVALAAFWVLKKVLFERTFNYQSIGRNQALILSSFLFLFLWEAVSLFFTENLSYGLKNIEGKLSLLILPIILYDIGIQYNHWIKMLKGYVYSLALCTVFLLYKSIEHYIGYGHLFVYHDFTSSLAFHAVFYSYYIFVAILISIFLYLKEELSKVEKILFVISFVLSIVGLIISASKNVLVVTTLFSLTALIVRSMKKRVGVKELGFFLLFLVIGFLAVSRVPSVGKRVAELTQLNGMENLTKIRNGEKLVESDIRKFNGTSLRITFWYVAVKKVMDKGAFLIGLTPGDRRDVLNEEYFKNGINPWYENYNIHNQFVQTFVELGIVGLLIYLLLHLQLFIIAIREKNFLLLALLSGLVIFQMTESIIERNKGIVFVVFLLIFFQRFNNYQTNKELSS